jgi:hypothetical protein
VSGPLRGGWPRAGSKDGVPAFARALRAAFVAACALATAACAHERTRALAIVPDGALAGSPLLSSDGPPDDGPARARATPVHATLAPAPVAEPASVVRRAAAGVPPPHRPMDPGDSLAAAARERFLRCPTSVDAESATIWLPAALASEARLSGSVVRADGPGRYVAEGIASLSLRRLSVRARRITLVSRFDGSSDVQVSARGSVSFRSDQPASLLEESGLRSLWLRNDVHTPLR